MKSPPESNIAKPPAGGRPRSLDDVKRREICALVAGGCPLRDAARYVRCSVKTIRREARRNPQFQAQLSNSEMYAQLSPLRAMQKAAGTHWRAAAWMLERAYPNRFARRDANAFGPLQARRLLNEVLEIIGSEIADPFQHERIAKRLRATFEYSLRVACDRRRSARDLRRAIGFFEQKEELNDPTAQFGFPAPNLDSFLKTNEPVGRMPQDPAPAPTEDVAPPAPISSTKPAVPGPESHADFADLLRAGLHLAAERFDNNSAQPPPPGELPNA